MVTITEALNIIQKQEVEFSTETRSLNDCIGFCLADDLSAPFDMPSFDNSAMDGYALCGIHKEYQITGEIAAGDPSSMKLESGEAVRIFTGAKVPENTTAVIMQEKTQVGAGKLFLDEIPKEGQCIRKKGGELKKGELVFNKGYKITPAGVGLIVGLGIEQIKVFSKPGIKLITTGNELIEPGKKKTEGQIYESNSFALKAAIEYIGFKIQNKRQISDNFDAIKAGIRTDLETSDVLILSGGISVGDYDFVKQALEENGVEELFYKVLQKPGKPLYFGRKGNKFVFALPGNPASSLSCFYIYVLPFLQKFSGGKNTGLPKFKIPIAHDFENRFDRPSFLKARLEDSQVEILNAQGSSMIQSMAVGNALVYIEEHASWKKGKLVDCYLIS